MDVSTIHRPRQSWGWLIPAAVVVLGLAAVPAHLSRLEPTDMARFGVTRLGRWLDLFGGSPAGAVDASANLPQVVAAVVDIDTDQARRHAVGAGTGIVLDSGGLVVTNNHVVEGAAAISATDIGNGRTYRARVLGHDRRHDIALVELGGATGLVAAPLGDSSQVAVGDNVVAIGNAGGRGGAPSRAPGTVTAINQTISAADDLTGRSERLTGVIQIAAPLRPGDSGGPLVNSTGQVVGIDTAGTQSYRMGTGGGQGFAISIDQVLATAQQIDRGHP